MGFPALRCQRRHRNPGDANCAPRQIATERRWRDAVARRDLIAPRVIAAGVAVQGKSESDARQEVRVAKAAGADFIKVFSEVPGDALARDPGRGTRAGNSRLRACAGAGRCVDCGESGAAKRRTSAADLRSLFYERARAAELTPERCGGSALTNLRDEQEGENARDFRPAVSAPGWRASSRKRSSSGPHSRPALL